MTGEGEGTPELIGLERVYASPRRVTIDGHAPEPGQRCGPAISIYRVMDAAVIAPSAQIKAR